MRKKRVREKEIPYMTAEWKQAIGNKRKYAVHFAKNRTVENLELKKKYRNIATQERRKELIGIRNQKSSNLDLMSSLMPSDHLLALKQKTVIRYAYNLMEAY